jgi:hypothetical protein
MTGAPLTFEEFSVKFQSHENNKGCGGSGHAAEIYKSCLPTKADISTARLTGAVLKLDNNMAKAFWYLAGLMFSRGVVSRNMEVSNVIALFKKGAKTDPSNYRGIALIEIILKVLTDVVISRVTAVLESSDPPALITEQSGFRELRESIAQYVALFETCRRRRMLGKRTYVAWTDFRKAYDTVCHVAVLSKLKEQGIDQTLLDFFDSLYYKPKIAAKSTEGVSAYQL